MLTRKKNYLSLFIVTLFSGAAVNVSAEWGGAEAAPAPPAPESDAKPAQLKPQSQPQNQQAKPNSKTITWLGVSLSDVPEVLLQQLPLEKGQGVMVKAVQPGSPAEASDVKAFDIITHFEGKAMAKPDQLNQLIYKTKPGSKVKVAVIRKGEKKTLNIILGSRVVTRPQPQAQQQSQQPPSFWQRNGMMPFANNNGNGWNMPFNNNNGSNGGNGWSMPFNNNNGSNGWSMPFNNNGGSWSMPFNSNGGNGWSMPFGGNNGNTYGNNGNMPFNPGSWNMGNNQNQNQRLRIQQGPNGLIQVYALVPNSTTGQPQPLTFQGTRDAVYQQIMQHQTIADTEKKLLIEGLDSRLSNSPMSNMPWGNGFPTMNNNGGMNNGNFNPFNWRN